MARILDVARSRHTHLQKTYAHMHARTNANVLNLSILFIFLFLSVFCSHVSLSASVGQILFTAYPYFYTTINPDAENETESVRYNHKECR